MITRVGLVALGFTALLYSIITKLPLLLESLVATRLAEILLLALAGATLLAGFVAMAWAAKDEFDQPICRAEYRDFIENDAGPVSAEVRRQFADLRSIYLSKMASGTVPLIAERD